MKNSLARFSAAAALLFLGACSIAPVVYVNDRHTIMEDEAAGEWPDFEKSLQANATEASPTPFKKVEANAAKKRLYNVLNGELVSQSQAAKPSK